MKEETLKFIEQYTTKFQRMEAIKKIGENENISFEDKVKLCSEGLELARELMTLKKSIETEFGEEDGGKPEHVIYFTIVNEILFEVVDANIGYTVLSIPSMCADRKQTKFYEWHLDKDDATKRCIEISKGK